MMLLEEKEWVLSELVLHTMNVHRTFVCVLSSLLQNGICCLQGLSSAKPDTHCMPSVLPLKVCESK